MEPWYKVATPRKEVREGRSFNPDEFAIALEQVVAGTAPEDYRDPKQFFSRTCFTRALREHVGMALRRLSGETANTAPVTIVGRLPTCISRIRPTLIAPRPTPTTSGKITRGAKYDCAASAAQATGRPRIIHDGIQRATLRQRNSPPPVGRELSLFLARPESIRPW